MILSTQNRATTVLAIILLPCLLYAQSITLNLLNDGNGGTNPSVAQSLIPGVPIPISAIPDSGYVFDKWELSSGVIVSDKRSTYTIVSAQVDCWIKARFVPAYSVVLDAKSGGTIEHSPQSLLRPNATEFISAVSDSHFLFSHWQIDSGLGIITDSLSAMTSISVSSDIRASAHFDSAYSITVISAIDSSVIYSQLQKKGAPFLMKRPSASSRISAVLWSIVDGDIIIDDVTAFEPYAQLQSDATVMVTVTKKQEYPITQLSTQYSFSEHGGNIDSIGRDGIYYYLESTGFPERITVSEVVPSWYKRLEFYGTDGTYSHLVSETFNETGTIVDEFLLPIIGQRYYFKVVPHSVPNLDEHITIHSIALMNVRVESQLTPGYLIDRIISPAQVCTVSVEQPPGFVFEQWNIESGSFTWLNGGVNDSVITIQADTTSIELKAQYTLDSLIQAEVFIKDIDVSNHPTICVTAQVKDSSQVPWLFLNGLDSSMFSLWQFNQRENPVFTEPREVRPISVSQKTTGLNVALVIDESNTMQGQRMIEARAAVYDFIGTMKANDKTGIVGFRGIGNEVIHSRMTSDTVELNRAVNNLHDVGGTNMVDGIFAGIETLKYEVGPKTLIAFSDGDVGYNISTIAQCLDSALKYGITVYAIGLDTLFADSLEVLNTLTTNTGGDLRTNEVTHLAALYHQIQLESRSEYQICYESPDSDLTGDTLTAYISLDHTGSHDSVQWEEHNMSPRIVLSDDTEALIKNGVSGLTGVTLSGRIESTFPVSVATLYFKHASSNVFIDVSLNSINGDSFSIHLPVEESTQPGLDFYVIAYTHNALYGKSPLIFEPWSHPHHISVGNKPPILEILDGGCYDTLSEHNSLEGVVTDSDGIQNLLLYSRSHGAFTYKKERVVVTNENHFIYDTSPITEVPQQMYLEARDGFGGLARYPEKGDLDYNYCTSLSTPSAVIVGGIQGDSLFQDSTWVRLQVPEDTVLSGIKIYYTLDSLVTPTKTSPFVLSGDSLLLNATQNITMRAYYAGGTYSQSLIGEGRFYKIEQLIPPELEIVQHNWMCDSLFADSMQVVFQYTPLLFEKIDIYYSINGAPFTMALSDTLVLQETATVHYYSISNTSRASDTLVKEFIRNDSVFDRSFANTIQFVDPETGQHVEALEDISATIIALDIEYHTQSFSMVDSLELFVEDAKGDVLKIVAVETSCHSGVYTAMVPFSFVQNIPVTTDDRVTAQIDYYSDQNATTLLVYLERDAQVRATLTITAGYKKAIRAVMLDRDTNGQGDGVLLQFSGALPELPQSIHALSWGKELEVEGVDLLNSNGVSYKNQDNHIVSSAVIIDLIEYQEELLSTRVNDSALAFIELSHTDNFGGQRLYLRDSVAPVLESVERRPASIHSYDVLDGTSFRADTLEFIFSEPVVVDSLDRVALWKRTFRLSNECEDGESEISFQMITQIDTLGSVWRATLEETIPELTDCIVVLKPSIGIHDESGVILAPKKMQLTGRERRSSPRVLLLNSIIGKESQYEVTEGYELSDFLPKNMTVLQIESEEAYTAKVYIYDTMGYHVTTLRSEFKYTGAQINDGLHYVKWDLTGQEGKPVGSGAYIWKIYLTFADGNTELFKLRSGFIRE